MCRTLGALLILAGFVVHAGCGTDDGVIVRVNGRDIRGQQVQAYLEGVTAGAWTDVDSRVASKLLDQFVVEEVVAGEWLESEGSIPADAASRAVLLRRFVYDRCGPVPTGAPEVVAEAVRERMRTAVPERVLIRQLLLPDLEAARAAKQRFEAGEDFVALSRDVSVAPNADGGGMIGWVERGTQPDDIEGEIFSLEVDGVSNPVEGPAGYHLFQALEVRSSGTVSEADAEAEVRRELESEMGREHLRSCIEQALKQADVEVVEENLWFEYRGRFTEE